MDNNFGKIVTAGVVFLAIFWGSHSSSNGGPKRPGAELIASIEGVSSSRLDVQTRPEVKIGYPKTSADVGPEDTSLFGESHAGEKDFYPVAVIGSPDVKASVAIVANLRTGESYFDVGGGRRWPMASVTKLMTAVVGTKMMPSDAVISIEKGDFYGDPSTATTFSPGERYRLSELVQAMLLASSNEAAEAIARTYGKSAFISLMNRQAELWGLTDTYFADPTGLSVSNQSTGRDMERMISKIFDHSPGVLKMTAVPKVVVTEVGTGARKTVSSINLFADWPDFLGGKTGYIEDSKGNLVSVFSVSGKPIVIIVLGSDDRFRETETLLNWFKNVFRPNR